MAPKRQADAPITGDPAAKRLKTPAGAVAAGAPAARPKIEITAGGATATASGSGAMGAPKMKTEAKAKAAAAAGAAKKPLAPSASASASASGSGDADDGPKRLRKPKKELSAAHAEFVALCERNPDGVREDDAAAALPHIDAVTRGKIVNDLVGSQRLQLYKEGGEGQMIYKLVSAEDIIKFDKLKPTEITIYRLIEHSKKQGMWIKDLRQRSGVTIAEVNKALRTLTTRQLIKVHKMQGDQMKNKRVYVLFDVEPGKDPAGGPWYVNGVYDAEFFDALRGACLKFVADAKENGSTASLVCDEVARSGLFNVACAPDDISRVLAALYYDGELELVPSPDQMMYRNRTGKPPHFTEVNVYWRTVRGGPLASHANTMPCGVCPVAEQCQVGGVINPRDCKYYEAYLSF